MLCKSIAILNLQCTLEWSWYFFQIKFTNFGLFECELKLFRETNNNSYNLFVCLFRSNIHTGLMQTTESDRGRWYGTKRPKAPMIHYVHLFSSSRRLIPIRWEPNQRFVLSTYIKKKLSKFSTALADRTGLPKISAILPKYPIFGWVFFHVFMGKKYKIRVSALRITF